MDEERRPPIAHKTRPCIPEPSPPHLSELKEPSLIEERRPLSPHGSRPLAAVSDDDLLRRLVEILSRSRRVEADLVAHIAEVDGRRLYAREAFPSMFAYCTDALHLSEGEAYLRIAVARASREHPMVLPMLADGRLHLSGIALLAPHLTRENRDVLLRRATHRSKRQIEELIAEVAPLEDVPALMRRLPERRSERAPAALASPSVAPISVVAAPALTAAAPTSTATAPTPSGMGRPVTPSLLPVVVVRTPCPDLPCVRPLVPAPPVVQPLSPGRYKVQFTASAELHEKLERLRALMRSQIPDGDLGAVIEAAVTEKLERLEARRFAAASRPRKNLSQTDTAPTSRHIPAAVRRAVRERDGDRCRYVDASGQRCDERHRLELHHLHPFGLGGNHQSENIRLMCHAHNAYLAEHDYGWEAMARFRGSGRRARGR